MTAHPASGRVIAGGSFTTVNGVQQRGMTSIDGVSGVLMPWAANQVIQNYGPNTQISGLTTDGQTIYGVGWAYFGAGGTTANFEGQFAADPLTGQLRWINGCRGDQYGLTVTGDVLYTAGHTHDCGMINYNPEQTPRVEQRGMAFDKRGSAVGRYNAYGPVAEWQPFAGRPSTDALYWWPDLSVGNFTGSFQAGWTVESNSQYVVYGGEFPRVNGANQQGLVRFALQTVAPNDEGPQGMATVTPTLTAMAPGVVRVAWTAPYDRDNRRLRYEVLRGNTMIASFQADSNQWTRTPMGFLDETAPPGTTQSYRVRVLDAFDNGGLSGTTSIAVPSGTRPTSAYVDSVQANGAIHLWRLDEATGTLSRDWIRSNNLTLSTDAVRGAAGAMLTETNAATTFPGTTSTTVVRGTTNFWQEGPQTFSVEAWIRTTSTQGGKIVGFGSANTGRSSSNLTDRHIYMTDTGELRFGLRPDYGTRRTINSPPGYNDGQWHHVVATLNSTGARLYADGELVAQDDTLSKAQVYYGYWRVGGDRLTSWPSAPTREAFEGTIDDVAIYPTALTPNQVEANFSASGRSNEPNTLPVASFTTSAVDGLDVTFDASDSADPDGTIASYAWDFDDGSAPGTGVAPQHRFPGTGSYDVTLTVTDNRGGTDPVTVPVSVQAPANQPPTAAFSSSVDDLTVNVNGSTSSDPEGPIASYLWDFNGEDTATGATATHTFATAGTKQVTLTVTDGGGESRSTTQDVTVSQPTGPQPFAADSFTRTVTNGFGTADDGGAWSITGSAANYSVSGGSGKVMNASAQTRAAYLTGAVSQDVNLVADVSLSRASTGGGAYLSVIGRRVSSGNDYLVKVRYQSDGSVVAYLNRTVGGTETTLAWTTVPGLTAAANDVLRVRLEVTGSPTTTARAKVWRAGQAEPSAWLVTNTSATPTALRAPGHVGVSLYLSSSWGAGPTPVLSLDNLSAVDPE